VRGKRAIDVRALDAWKCAPRESNKNKSETSTSAKSAHTLNQQAQETSKKAPRLAKTYHDAAHRPNVYRGAIQPTAQQQLGRSILACDDLKAGGEGLVGVPKITGQAEIGDLEDALGGEQEVVWFEIAVVVGRREERRE